MQNDPKTHQHRLTLETTNLTWLEGTMETPDCAEAEAGKTLFEVTAITAGLGNGWHFTRESLKSSLPLWEGVEIFIDHQTSQIRSLRDLAGIGYDACFDETSAGIQLKVRPSGPSGRLLRAVGAEWLQTQDPRPRLGFSADVIFRADGKTVKEILKVLSLDLVFRPARGGIFNRVLNQINPKENPMNDLETQNEANTTENEMQQTMLETRQTLLALKLQQSNLPEPALHYLQKEFQHKKFWRLPELEEAIQTQRELAASYQSKQSIQSAGRIESIRSSQERLQAAVDDLFGAPRAANMHGNAVPRLSGVRELYLTLTEDYEFRGEINTQHTQLATSDNISNVLMNSFNKIILDKWEELGRAGYRWWEKIVQVEHVNSLQPVSGILLGEVSALSSIAEGASYSELGITDSGETKNFTKYGGLLPITLEMIDKDETHKMRQLPLKMAISTHRNISGLVSNVFTSSNGTGPIMTDGYHVFDAGHNNLGTTALSTASFEAASQAIYNQGMLSTDTVKPKLALDARYLLVPRSLMLTAKQILYPVFGHEANYFSDNMLRGESGDVIVVPNWSDANDWAAIADPRLAPGIIIAERNGLMPEIFVADNEQGFDMVHNDVINLKVRHYLAVFAADYRPMFKANVA